MEDEGVGEWKDCQSREEEGCQQVWTRQTMKEEDSMTGHFVSAPDRLSERKYGQRCKNSRGLPTVCLKADDGSEVEQNIYLPLFRGKETEETSVDDDTVMWMGEGE